MSKPAIIAKITAKDGQRDALAELFGKVMDSVKADEPGTLVYVMHDDAKDPNVIWFYELYADDAALAAHGGNSVMKALGKDLGAHMAGRPELFFVTPRGGKGLDV